METLNTGDLILYSNKQGSWLRSLFDKSLVYEHCGIVLRDPTFINPNLRGLYVWQTKFTEPAKVQEEIQEEESQNEEVENNDETSTSEESSNTTQEEQPSFELEIVPLQQILEHSVWDSIEYRSLTTKKPHFTNEFLSTLVSVSQNDVFPEGLDNKVLGTETTKVNVGASFVGYVYVKADILNNETVWTTLRPQDLTSECENIRFNIGVSLNPVTSLD